MGWERIPEDVWHQQAGHVERYEWAAELVNPSDVVLDVACGIGYGAEILAPSRCRYIGVDLPGIPSPTFAEFGTFLEADIDLWDGPSEPFDVAICFETLEHVRDLTHLLDILHQACRLVLVSVPTVPTVGLNPWHLRDFTEADIPQLFADWTIEHVWQQPQERSHVWAFAR